MAGGAPLFNGGKVLRFVGRMERCRMEDTRMMWVYRWLRREGFEENG